MPEQTPLTETNINVWHVLFNSRGHFLLHVLPSSLLSLEWNLGAACWWSRLGGGWRRHAERSWPCTSSPPLTSSSLHRFCLPLVLASLPTMATGEEITPALQGSWGDFWLFRFFVNAAGYASIVVPGFLLIQYFKRRNYLETGKGRSFPSTSCLPVSSPHPLGQPHSVLTGCFPNLLY